MRPQLKSFVESRSRRLRIQLICRMTIYYIRGGSGENAFLFWVQERETEAIVAIQNFRICKEYGNLGKWTIFEGSSSVFYDFWAILWRRFLHFWLWARSWHCESNSWLLLVSEHKEKKKKQNVRFRISKFDTYLEKSSKYTQTASTWQFLRRVGDELVELNPMTPTTAQIVLKYCNWIYWIHILFARVGKHHETFGNSSPQASGAVRTCEDRKLWSARRT